MDRFKFITEKNFSELPKTSGVYCFYDKHEILYIGKAINLQSRVKNHFFQPAYRDGLYIEKVNKIGYLETNSEIDALILEANLIKKHQPKFNVVWRDDKNYFYVAIVENDHLPRRVKAGKIPYIFITHQKNYENSEYIGPFVDGTSLKKVLRFLRKVFPYYSVKKHPKTKCTYCHLDLCPGPNPDLKDYRKSLKKLILILQGKRNAVLNSFKKEMNFLSKENKFEEAGKIRDKIFALQNVMSHTHVIEPSKIQDDAWPKTENILKGLLNLSKNISRVECYDISNIQGKQATGSMIVFIDGQPNKNLYRKFKIKSPEKPNDILMLKEVLTRRFSHTEWNYPEIILIDGGKGQLNAAISVLSVIPSLTRNPETRQNSPTLDSGFRQNDIKVISIAKGKQELYIEGRKDPIPLKNLPREIYNLVLQLDNEAHRFAITYHKKLRKKNLLN